MLQKLPKTIGDTVTLGSIVALGISPTEDKKKHVCFASFERGGELISYEIINHSLQSWLHDLIYDYILEASTKEGIEREDFKYRVTERGFQLLDYNGNILREAYSR